MNVLISAESSVFCCYLEFGMGVLLRFAEGIVFFDDLLQPVFVPLKLCAFAFFLVLKFEPV